MPFFRSNIYNNYWTFKKSKTEKCLITGDLTNYTEEKIENTFSHRIEKSKYFLSLEQFKIFHNPSMKRLVFMTKYGTGKTLLMSAKARKLIEKKEKVVIIVFHEKDISLVTVKFKSLFLPKKSEPKSKHVVNESKVVIEGLKIGQTGNHFNQKHPFCNPYNVSKHYKSTI